VVAGRTYTAQIVVALGADWAEVAAADQRTTILTHALVQTSADTGASILCGEGIPTGAATVLTCPITIPDQPGEQLTITVAVGGDLLIGGNTAMAVTTYTHTIR
jgi:hypothetical protein